METGYYRLQSSLIGPPNGTLYAPVGSEYVDLQTGTKYLKEVGFDNQGWVVCCGSGGENAELRDRLTRLEELLASLEYVPRQLDEAPCHAPQSPAGEKAPAAGTALRA